ncbi:hypothetical protein K1719_009547 [Acacia pycnantha]|nr:hypothetical protein K1719_009547 [Acacia pycnantha]
MNSSFLFRPPYIPNHIPDPKYVRILDTTLRDGEQSVGVCMNSKQKLKIAQQLGKLGVDVIDAGFPASSKDDFEAVKIIAQEFGNNVTTDTANGGYVPVITGTCRCIENDIRTAWEAVKYAKRPRIQMFIATSDIHMKYKLKKTKEEVLETARSMVKFARSLGCHDIGFCAEDATRSKREFLYEIFGQVIKEGATTVTVVDTVGISMPSEYGKLVADTKANTPGIENAIIASHCHNDLGLATANTIEGARNGARQLEVTINGIGERAGNASLEEVVMILKCGANDVLSGLYTRINTRQIFMTSKMVEDGIHQDGMLKYKGTYEIICPEDVGFERVGKNGIVLGKLSGRNGLRKRLEELGYELEDEQMEDMFWSFKALAELTKVMKVFF